MVASGIGKVAKMGAAWATLTWAHRCLMDDIVSACAATEDPGLAGDVGRVPALS
jgi:hypothetical protein